MASKSVLKLSAINNFFGSYSQKALSRGENALESGHLSSFTYDGECSVVKARIHASQRRVVYNVFIEFSRTEVTKATCDCVRGLVSCHHMAAVMLHTHKTISVTNVGCMWSAKSSKRERSSGEPMSKVVSSRDFKAFRSPLNLELMKKKILDTVKTFLDGEAAQIAWLLSPEPTPSDNVPSLNVNHPRDVILSEQFAEARCKFDFLNESLGITPDGIEEVAAATDGQSTNPSWIAVRQLRLTASNFGGILDVYKKKKNTGVPSPSLLKKLYQPPNLEKVKATQWGIEHEPVALKKICDDYQKKVSATGIWLHECGYLGASPDAIVVNEDAIVEVKCPWSMRDEDLIVVLQENKEYFIGKFDGDWVVNVNHPFFHQIQGQLHLCKKSICYFVAWTPKSLVPVIVPADPNWINNICLLQKFYVDHFVPYVLKRNK